MATLSNVTLSIVRNAANADVTVEFDITWSAFDRTTNVPYVESFRLIGDDTGQDIDDAGPGDDPIVIGLQLQQLVSANGRATTHRTRTRSIPFENLDEDTVPFPNAADDEIRAVVTLTPQLPTVTSRESNLVTVFA